MQAGLVDIEGHLGLTAEVISKLGEDFFGGRGNDHRNAARDGCVSEQADHSTLAGSRRHLDEAARLSRIEVLNTGFQRCLLVRPEIDQELKGN